MNNFVSTLLTGWTSIFPETPATDQQGNIYGDKTYQYYWVGDVFGPISIVMYILMGLVGAAGAVYAIYLGIQLARADEQGKRDEAKKHLITVLIAVAVTIVFVIFFNELLPMIVKAFMGNFSGPNPDAKDLLGTISK